MENAVIEAMDKMGRRVNDRIIRKWASQRGIQGKAYAKDPVFNTPTNSVIEMDLSYGGQKAWISEFGKGSLVDKSNNNDWLEKYKSSGRFNKARLSPLNSATKKLSVVSRTPGVSYEDLDGNILTATKKFPREGFNLEWWAARGKGKPYRKAFAPIPALHTAQDQVEAAANEFGEAINASIKEWMKHNLLK